MSGATLRGRAAAGGLTLGQTLERASARLRAVGIEGARRDARLLLAVALDLAPAQVLAYPERTLSAAQGVAADRLIDRRARHEPVSRILGRREFWGLEFRITPDTLDPRPDSETLVAGVLARVARGTQPCRILDLGTGSGCLLLALLSELTAAEGLGTDLNPGALAAARDNAVRLGLSGRARFVQADWTGGLAGIWQVIVSNPPYIVAGEIESLSPEVARYDPRLALDAGLDGLNSYRKLIPRAAGLLAPDGLLALEIGAGQGDEVSRLMTQSGLGAIERIADLSGTERCLIGHLAGPRSGSQIEGNVKK